MKCKNCGKEVKDNWKVCPWCKASLVQVTLKCPNCGEEVDDSWNICPVCEYPLHLEDKQNSSYTHKQENGKLDLTSLIEEAKRTRNYRFNGDKVCAPIGKTDKVFDFIMDSSSQPSALVLSGTGGGKSSVLHTLIFSLASTYSPEEVELYIADFKSEDTSYEFGLYQKGEKLYLPHIKFLLLKGTEESACDLFDTIKQIHDARMEQMYEANVASIERYNNSDEVKSGKLEKMSRIVVLIDECDQFFDYKYKTIKGELSLDQEFAKLLRLLRSSGIYIVFSGRSMEGMRNTAYLIGTKIILNMNQSWPYLRGWPEDMRVTTGDDTGGVTYEKFIKTYDRGYALIKVNSRSPIEVVRLAYTGSTGGEEQVRLAEEIRQKYK